MCKCSAITGTLHTVHTKMLFLTLPFSLPKGNEWAWHSSHDSKESGVQGNTSQNPKHTTSLGRKSNAWACGENSNRGSQGFINLHAIWGFTGSPWSLWIHLLIACFIQNRGKIIPALLKIKVLSLTVPWRTFCFSLRDFRLFKCFSKKIVILRIGNWEVLWRTPPKKVILQNCWKKNYILEGIFLRMWVVVYECCSLDDQCWIRNNGWVTITILKIITMNVNFFWTLLTSTVQTNQWNILQYIFFYVPQKKEVQNDIKVSK